MPEESNKGFPVSTALNFTAAAIAVIAAAATIITDPSVITQTLMAKTFLKMFSSKIVYILFYWVYFCAVYIACLLYEKYHSNDLGISTLVSKNYQLTIWIWLPAAFIIFYIHKMTIYETGIDPESGLYISYWISFVFKSYGPVVGLIVATGFLVYGAYLVTLGRVSIDGQWKTHIYKYENPRLQENFIYSKVRHPIYNGQNYMAIGTSIVLDTVFCIIFPLAVIFYNTKRSINEEAELSKMVGINYKEYKRSVPISMWYPFF